MFETEQIHCINLYISAHSVLPPSFNVILKINFGVNLILGKEYLSQDDSSWANSQAPVSHITARKSYNYFQNFIKYGMSISMLPSKLLCGFA